ncbi:MAG: SusD/RagB family nutrient-binding outer membrane lipoprotein [Dysgonamonadaceae bacterium]
MKTRNIYILLIALVCSSCSSWIDPSVNVDPNSPSDVGVADLVAPIEVNLGYVVGGDLTRVTSEWTQQIAGLQSQSADVDIYNISESDVNNSWSYNLYSPGMINSKILINKSVANASPYYTGIAQVLMAYHLGVTTDLWGDIPYSDALNGATGQSKSKYDTQEAVYDSIFSLLDNAIVNLNAKSSAFVPGDEDIIYKGSLSNWIKTAYALKARYYLHLSKVDATAYTKVKEALANAYTSNDDDFKVVFNSAYSNSNPMYQFQNERVSYIGANSYMLSMLTATSDPRTSAYYSGTVGSASGEGNSEASPVGANYASAASPVYLMTYAEIKFIEAEVYLATDPKRAAQAYNDGLKASLDREGVYDATWYGKQELTQSTITLGKIMNQKYLSSFLQLEAFNDWRRTGYPSLSLAQGAVTTSIPRRLPYPQDERLYNNANMPQGVKITDRIWWDKQ